MNRRDSKRPQALPVSSKLTDRADLPHRRVMGTISSVASEPRHVGAQIRHLYRLTYDLLPHPLPVIGTTTATICSSMTEHRNASENDSQQYRPEQRRQT